MEPERTNSDQQAQPPCAPTERVSNGELLVTAIDEMELLLSHATQAGKVVPVKRIKVLVDAKHAARNGGVSADMETAFWHEFQELGQQLQPISVDSLKATSKRFGQPSLIGRILPMSNRSIASLAVRRYQIWSVIALILLLVTQIYTIFGSNAVSDIRDLVSKSDAELLKIADLNRRAAEAPAAEAALILQEIRDADTRLNQMYDRLGASYELLAIWFPVHFGVLNPNVAQDPTRLQIAQIILESLSKYLLPLLYGLLGACVYVLRTLSLEIKDLVYTVESDIRFQLRIYLGSLAGLAIGWLITEQTAPAIVQSIAPIALAFLAGYSVELLFSAMDTIIDAFIKASKKSPTGQ